MGKAFQSHECSLWKGLRDISKPKKCHFPVDCGTAGPQGPSQAPAHPWHHTKPFPASRDAQESWSCSGLTAGKGHQIPINSRYFQGITTWGKESAEFPGWEDVSQQWAEGRAVTVTAWVLAAQKMGILSWKSSRGFTAPIWSIKAGLFWVCLGGEEHQGAAGELGRKRCLRWVPPWEHFYGAAWSGHAHCRVLTLADSFKRDVCVMEGF